MQSTVFINVAALLCAITCLVIASQATSLDEVERKQAAAIVASDVIVEDSAELDKRSPSASFWKRGKAFWKRGENEALADEDEDAFWKRAGPSSARFWKRPAGSARSNAFWKRGDNPQFNPTGW